MKNTRNLKFRIYSFEVKCLALIGHGLMRGKNKTQILRRLKKELLLFSNTVKLLDDEYNAIWNMCLDSYNRLSRNVRAKRTDAEAVYLAIRNTIPSVESFKNVLSRAVETRNKDNYLRKLFNNGIFYLCSRHTNCAETHENFQGKIYVSRAWKSRCLDDELVQKVGYYIKNHKCMMIEDVCDAPVYMVSRPNCRHYFRKMDVDEVLHSSVNKLLKKYNMIKTDFNSYEYSQYRKYYERLKVLVALRNICECELLEKDIKETRKMIKKWLPEI